ncbi:hypothetical protein C9374_003537 [Naegleria lovaniensis]|uniref:EF-hand domain-containing protein n=1 Tax=Naegleria lovaniensis TaxID=51637 RepID=A0AA88KPT7_NAELO|nr:uncharacterized protein C9374_003537 [Naegleria lovaniensis]KAG2385722.1 hypothetical protein C9374_003537 [Naegleria lovaniensis]
MLSAAEEPRTPTPSHGGDIPLNASVAMDDLNVSAIQNSSMNGLDASAILDPSQLESTTASSRVPPSSSNANSRPSTSASVMGGKQSSLGFGKGEELSPETIKRYTEAFKLYEAKKTIKPGKAPAADADDGKTKKDGKDAKAKKPDPKKTNSKDAKKSTSPQPETPPTPPQPQITILKNHVLLSDLIILMRALMKNPKEKDLPIYLSVLPNAEEVTQRGQLTLDEFLKIMQLASLPNQDDHFKILDAFETFDTSNFQGTIEPEELKNILLNLGESDLMTPEEVQEIIQQFTDPETKMIRYDDFLKTCLSNTDIHDPPPPKPKTTKKSSKDGNKSSAK